MGRDALIAELPTRNKSLRLVLVFPNDSAERTYICGPAEKVQKELDKYVKT